MLFIANTNTNIGFAGLPGFPGWETEEEIGLLHALRRFLEFFLRSKPQA
jgi:hypothetical protein